jgi:thiol-disulfide isomerase/thioredoxin
LLDSLLVQKDPKGAYARMSAFQNANQERNSSMRQEKLEKLLHDFPKAEWNHNPKGQGFIYYSVDRGLGELYFANKQFDKLIPYAAGMDFKSENEVFRWNVMRAYMFKMIGYDTLYQVATPMMKDLVAKVKDGSYIEEGVFDAAKAQENANEQLDNELNIYIQLLNSLGKYAEAKEYFAYLSAKGRYGKAELNELHMNILEKLNEKEAIQPLLENSVNANAVAPAMFSKLKEMYVEKYKNTDGYEAYLNSLRSADEKAKLEKHVKEHMANWEYQPFALENAEGELVRSSDWGDKIVVVDFWATWCKPCIEAFPGMQLLIDKYAKDSSVAVYFIGTMQFGDYKTKSVNYVKSKGYRGFNLLHDAVNKKTGEQDVVYRSFMPYFKASGIPRKVVLKDGIMRYTSEGYSGSPSQLADELSYVIELLKAEK